MGLNIKPCCKSYLVVEAWAMIFPPIGFFGSAANIAAAPSTCATTWLVITTATPYWKKYWDMYNVLLTFWNFILIALLSYRLSLIWEEIKGHTLNTSVCSIYLLKLVSSKFMRILKIWWNQHWSVESLTHVTQ